MKSMSDAALAALEDGSARVTAAVAIMCDPPVFCWGGYGVLNLAAFGDDNDYLPLGDRGLAQASGGAIGGSEQNLTLALSGIEAAVIELVDADELKRAPVVVRQLIFDGTGTQLLDALVWRRGRIDQVTPVETVGGEARIEATVEGAARGLGRRGGRMRSDADQRLVKSNDGGLRFVAFAAEKQLYWGGRKPQSAGSALPSTGSGIIDTIGAEV